MSDKRKHARYTTQTAARIDELTEGESLLRDLSITGCRIECPKNSSMELNRQYQLKVIPESEARIDSFMLLVEMKWIRAMDDSSEIGLSIVESPKGRTFLNYVDYLSWRYSHGSSMTGDSGQELPQEA